MLDNHTIADSGVEIEQSHDTVCADPKALLPQLGTAMALDEVPDDVVSDDVVFGDVVQSWDYTQGDEDTMGTYNYWV